MPRALQFILFVAVALAVYTALHFFIYWRIASGLELGAGARRLLKWILIAGSLSFPLAEFLSGFTWSVPLVYAGFVWFGLLCFALSAFLLEWLSSLFLRNGGRAAVWISLAVVFGLAAYSAWNQARPPRKKSIALILPGLPAGAPITLVHLSDLHIGYHTPLARVRALVGRINAENPDLVAISGDLIDRDLCRRPEYCRELAGLRCRHGVYAVTGNHEYYAGLDRFAGFARAAGIRVLRNQSAAVAGRLLLAGINDDEGRNFTGGGPDLAAAVAGADRRLPVVLLYHRPHAFRAHAAAGVRLQLSGHTHAGQFPPADLFVRFLFRYPYGLYRRGEAFIYTTCGTGVWGPPMRLFSRDEFVVFTLTGRK